MARLSERRPGREDGGFTRTFGDAGLGALLSRTHATSISAGTELEKKIQDLHANLMTAEQLGQFLINWPTSLHLKKQFAGSFALCSV